MKLNSDASLALAAALFREHDRDWSKVAAAGRLRDDGIIVVKRPTSTKHVGEPTTEPTTAREG